METVKQQVQTLLRRLQDDCTLEDVQHHLYVIEKVRRGIQRADGEEALSQHQVEEQLKRWLSK